MFQNNYDHATQIKIARITGGFYLAFIITSVLANSLGHIGLGTTPKVYKSITTDLFSFRLGLVIAFVSAFVFLLSAWGLFILLRPTNKDFALLFLVLNAIGVSIQCASMLWLAFPMLQGDVASRMQAFSPAQMEGLSNLSINVYRTGFVATQLFFGMWLFPLGYLVYKSKSLPRFLGVLLLLDGIAELIWFVQVLLWPTAPAAIRYPGTAVSLLAEVGLALWLLVKGVKISEFAESRP